MKRLLTIFMIVFFSGISHSQNLYNNLWKKVEKFEVDGLPKSALEVVDQIAVKAKNDNNAIQQIKAMLFKSKFALILEEDAQLKVINSFKAQIAESPFPVKNVLENMIAKLYWEYFQRNRYKFYNRTKTTEKVDKEDFRTWDLQTLFNEIDIHYSNSLQNSLMLQLKELIGFDDLLIVKNNSKTFRPTLYDLLAHNALSFYKTDENSITKPAFKFEIDDDAYLSDAQTFSKLNISSQDSTSLQLKALHIYQELINFHLKDSLPYALADVNIQRLRYVKEQAVFDNKEAILISTLKADSKRVKDHEVSGLYDHELAAIYNTRGSAYDPKTNEGPRWKIKEALELCEAVIQKFPDSRGAEKCQVLRENILEKSLNIKSESHLPIQSNARLLVEYKNHKQLHLNVYRLSLNQLKKLNSTYRKEEQLDFIKKLKVVTQWQSDLRDEQDYQKHSTEILLPPLDNGFYVVLASPEAANEQTFAFEKIQITNLALVEKSTGTEQIYQVIDRRNGQPIQNAKVTVDFLIRNYTEMTRQYTTDAMGEFRIQRNSDKYYYLSTKVTNGNDIAFFDEGHISAHRRWNNQEPKVGYKAFLFTDRSIYRPGQTVYFKAIIIKTSDGKSEVVPNERFYADLYDPNDDELATLELASNTFGSVSGEFIVPSGRLNGSYYIELYADSNKIDVNIEHYFSVEEYKRPKFEAKFNPVTQTYKVNDSVTVKGIAEAYAGSTISDAKVVYRVHRKVQYPRWYYWYRPLVFK